jgi:hypothetical protein
MMPAMPVPSVTMPAVAVVPMPGLLDHAVLNCGGGRCRLWQRRGGGCRRERGTRNEK